MMAFFTAPKIAWGPGAVEQLSGLGARRAFLVVDPTLARADRHRRVVEELQKSDTTVEVLAELPIEPTLSGVRDAAPRIRAFAPDWVVALGGGSTIDFAKGLWVALREPAIDLGQVGPLTELDLRRSARFAAIPTTSGSGSEVSWSATLRADDGRVVEVASRELVPDWALLDPGFPSTMPRDVTAYTAADAIAHALEAFVSAWANPFSDAAASAALGAAVAALPKVVRHPADPDARAELHAAATLAGLAASNAQLGLAHALAHALAGRFAAPHGRLVAAVLPRVVEFNFPSARDRYARLEGPMRAPGLAQNRDALAQRLRGLFESAGLSGGLPALGIGAAELAAARGELVARLRASPSASANPRIPSEEEAGALLDALGRDGVGPP